MPDLMIVAAGMGSRMNSSLPKALTPINDDGVLNIENTILQLSKSQHINNIFVVTNKNAYKIWAPFFSEVFNDVHNPLKYSRNIRNVPIDSGRGDGHAVLQALQALRDGNVTISENIIICWGDAVFTGPQIIKEMVDELEVRQLQNIADFHGIVPFVQKKNPYVHLNGPDGIIAGAYFSKLGETFHVGNHDQSIFFFNSEFLYSCLSAIHAAFNRENEYITPNHELSLLYTFHYLKNIGKPVSMYETKYPTYGFNTPEELAAVKLKLIDVAEREQMEKEAQCAQP